MSRGYVARKRWSVVAGRQIARVSMFNEHGHEFFQIIDAESRGYRDRLHEAVELIAEAMAIGCDPGEVRVAA